MFVIMSGKRKCDYASVLDHLQTHVEVPPTRVVLDFEIGMWEAIRAHAFFSASQLQGCLFHFTQCIWRKVQDLGMRQDYINDDGTRLVGIFLNLIISY